MLLMEWTGPVLTLTMIAYLSTAIGPNFYPK